MSLEIRQDSHYQGKNWWKWSIWIEGPKEELDQIDNVTYVLHPSFANPVRTVTNRASRFKLSAQGWGIFSIRANLLKKDGSTDTRVHELELSYPDNLYEVPLHTGEAPLATIEDAEDLRSDTTISNVLPSPEFSGHRMATKKVRIEIGQLANEYENVRRTMPAGDPRTRKMGAIASKMRSLAHSAQPFIKDFLESPSAGERLAGVSILEAIPDPRYLTWLAERIKTEKPFIGYHASRALLNATRSLGPSYADELQDAIARAQANLNSHDWKDPNQVSVLRQAELALKR
jgi:transcription initiation factor IIF auxiliary subunit